MKFQIMMDILFTLLVKKQISAGELARRNGVSVRSIYRYVDELTVSGVPIDIRHGRNGGIYVSDSFKLPAGFMTKEEYGAALSAMRAMQGQVENEALDSAIEKLSSREKSDRRIDLTVSGDVIVDSSTWGDRRFSDKIKVLQDSIRTRETLEIDYISRSGEHTKRKIDPHTLVYKQNIWYVYAYCHKRKQFRLFKIGRIRTTRKTEQSFEIRPFDQADIPLNFQREQAERIRVKLEIAENILPDAEEWLGVECIRKEKGKFIAEMELPQNEGLIYKILGFGEGIKVLYPAEIGAAVKQAARKTAAVYE